MTLKYWYRFWRHVVAFLYLNTPLRSYGELMLGPVTIAERAVLKSSAADVGHKKR